jgi:two-component system, cell cycle response regulator CtrA
MLVLHVGERPFRRAGDAEIVRRCGVRAEHVTSGEEALEFLRLYEYDIVLLDLDLPDVTGNVLIRRMRAARITVPVLAFCGGTSAGIRAQALDLGADDLLSDTCDMDELLARMRAIVRRTLGHTNSSLRCGSVQLNMNSRDVRVNGARLALSRREYSVLELLFLKRGMILTKGYFLNHLYTGSEEPEMKTIDIIVCRLRKKLAAAGASTLIDTVWGSGYILRDQPATEAIAHQSQPAWADNALAIVGQSTSAWVDNALAVA